MAKSSTLDVPRRVRRVCVHLPPRVRSVEQRPLATGLGEADEALFDKMLVERVHAGPVAVHGSCLGGDDRPERASHPFAPTIDRSQGAISRPWRRRGDLVP
jgi:hypothetical protein